MATALDAAGFATEARQVIEEGIAARMLNATGAAKTFLTKTAARATQEKASLAGLQTRAASDATGATALKAGDAVFGTGDYAKAATLYQAAVQKGTVDANLANTRLGMALALAGQRAEAEAALRAVTGPRADLAGYWLAWLARRA
jgi:monomeric isocitrate dehydrogenase